MPALKAKKLESPLKRSFSFEEHGGDRQQAKRKKMDFSTTSAPKRKNKKNTTPTIHDEVSNHSHDTGPFEESDDSNPFSATPSSTSSITAIQQQLAAFAMQQQSHGHSSENEVRVAQEQASFVPQFVVPPAEEQHESNFSNATTGANVPSDPFLAQLLTASGDSSYYHHYLQNHLMDSQQQQQQQHQQQQQQFQQQQQLIHQSQVHQLQLQLQQRQFEHQQIQMVFNDNSNLHSPCGDNLDSLFSSLFGSNALGNGVSNTAGSNSLDSCGGSMDSYADTSDSSAIDTGFLGSPFL